MRWGELWCYVLAPLVRWGEVWCCVLAPPARAPLTGGAVLLSTGSFSKGSSQWGSCGAVYWLPHPRLLSLGDLWCCVLTPPPRASLVRRVELWCCVLAPPPSVPLVRWGSCGAVYWLPHQGLL